MKKTTFILMSAVFLMACKGGAKASPEMTEFMSLISKNKGISVPAAKFGYSPQDVPLDLYELREPTVVSQKGDCYNMNVKHGVVDSTVEVCWANKKITSIKDI